MKYLKTLVLMQLKDKIDLSFTKTKKTLIRKVVFTLLKFVGIMAGTYIVRLLLNMIIFHNSDTPQIMIVLLTFLLGISVITCTVGLVKSLYYADDNRVLITFPVGNNTIFASKMLVYYFYELIKEYSLIVPIILGCGLYSVMPIGSNILSIAFIPWMLVVMTIVPMVPVLLGALLSIPGLFIVRFLNRYPIIKLTLYGAILVAIAFGIVMAVGYIPENIDLINQGATIINGIKDFLLAFERVVLPISWLVYMFAGTKSPSGLNYVIGGESFMYFGLMIALIVVLFAIVYMLSRPLFFNMMSKSFEHKHVNAKSQINKKHGKLYAFSVKELRLCVLNTEISFGFLVTYIAVPVMIYVLNKFYVAMDTRLKGQVMTYAFNLLIMLLPMLASNSVIATLYSKEGRAGYLKKTEPIDVITPLICKIVFFMMAAAVSIGVTVAVFGHFVHEIFKWYDLVLLALTLICLQYGHALFSALADIMNPQNEQYATVGESAQNPNEGKSTILAFVLSAVFAIFSFVLFNETALATGAVTTAVLRLFAISAVFFAVMIFLFVKSVKVYYYER